jgi:hypothetical protein
LNKAITHVQFIETCKEIFVLSSLIALALAATSPASTPPTDPDLSLVCQIKDWAPPPFVSSSDAARAQLGDDDRKLVEQYEKSLRDKSRERESGSIGVTEFDRFVEHGFNDAWHARPDLKPIFEAASSRYSRTIGIDRALATDNERVLAEHESAKWAKPYVGKFVQLRRIGGLLTWQESLRKIIDKAVANLPEAQSGLIPSLDSTDSSLIFALTPADADNGTLRKTTASIDRYTGELLLERTGSNGRLLYTLSGICNEQMQPRF